MFANHQWLSIEEAEENSAADFVLTDIVMTVEVSVEH